MLHTFGVFYKRKLKINIFPGNWAASFILQYRHNIDIMLTPNEIMSGRAHVSQKTIGKRASEETVSRKRSVRSVQKMKMKGRDRTIEVERGADKGHSDRVMSHPVEHSSIFLSLCFTLSPSAPSVCLFWQQRLRWLAADHLFQQLEKHLMCFNIWVWICCRYCFGCFCLYVSEIVLFSVFA